MLSSVENPSSKKDEQAKSPSDVGGALPSEELLTRQSAEAVKYMKSIGLKIDTEELPIDRILRIAKDCGADTLEGADAMDITKRAVESGFEKSVATELLSKLEEQKRILKRPDGRFTTLSEVK
jgi:DNA replicative helicase MCM subunit Mcm2 (Cdc46/Mcm family)